MSLIWLGVAWLAGLALGYGRDLRSWWPVACWLGVALLAAAALWPRQRRALIWSAVLLATLALAVWRVGLLPTSAASLPSGRITALRGQVIDWPERGSRRDTAIVAVDQVRSGNAWQPATARVRAEVPLAPAVGRGDRVELYGTYRPTDQIDLAGFRHWLEQRQLAGQFQANAATILATGERTSLGAQRFALLGTVEEHLRRHIPGAEGALATGILLGDDALLPERTRDAFAATSTAHTMALSGWNITLIAGLCALIGRTLRQARTRLWLGGSIVAIWAFVYFVGASPTIARAALMGTAYLLAELLGRRGDALTLLAATAIALTAYRPATLLDIGFQLSCAATAGLIILAPRLTAFFQRARLHKKIAAVAAATLAAEVATLPLVLHHFGQLSRLTLPANLLIEPLVPPIMLGAFATALVGLIPGPLATIPGLLTWVPARLMLLTVETLGAQPWAVQRIEDPIGWPLTLALYILIATAIGTPRWLPALRAIVATAPTQPRPTLTPFAAALFGGLIVGAWLLLLLR